MSVCVTVFEGLPNWFSIIFYIFIFIFFYRQLDSPKYRKIHIMKNTETIRKMVSDTALSESSLNQRAFIGQPACRPAAE